MLQEDFISFILGLQPDHVAVVTAPAGAGKTHAAMTATSKMLSTSRVLIVAPTHIAVEELASKLPAETVCDVTFSTTASAVGRFLRMNKSTGKLENRFGPKSMSYDLIIVDELSAVPSCDLHRILQSNSPTVLMGDQEQLPAVLSKAPAVWNDSWQDYAEYNSKVFSYFTLEGQHRAKGVLFDTISKYRDKIAPLTVSLKDDHGAIRVLYSVDNFRHDFVEQLTKAYDEGTLADFCYLAYRNETVAAIQKQLRSKVFKSDNFVPTEVLRVAQHKFLRTGAQVTVLSASESHTIVGGQSIRTSNLEVQSKNGQRDLVRAVHPSFVDEYHSLLEFYKTEQMWTQFFELEAKFSVLQNANAITCHKSQGRTIKYVWTDVNDICSRRKMLYVAHSRAARVLTAVWPAATWTLPKGHPPLTYETPTFESCK